MTFYELQQRLVAHLRRRIRGGEATERGMSQMAGISQPHLHDGLYGICAEFVDSVNRMRERSALDRDPSDYTEYSLQEDSTNLVEINVRGRILQVEFRATPELVSTEDFRVPYTLAGTVRAFNQE